MYWLLSILGDYRFHIGFRDATPILENKIGKHMEHVLEAGTIQEFIGRRGPFGGCLGVIQGFCRVCSLGLGA